MVDLLASLNLYRYAQLFKDQEISGRKLKTMSKEDLQVSTTVVRSGVCCVGGETVAMSVAAWLVEKLKWEDIVLRIKFSFHALNLFKEST